MVGRFRHGEGAVEGGGERGLGLWAAIWRRYGAVPVVKEAGGVREVDEAEPEFVGVGPEAGAAADWRRQEQLDGKYSVDVGFSLRWRSSQLTLVFLGPQASVRKRRFGVVKDGMNFRATACPGDGERSTRGGAGLWVKGAQDVAPWSQRASLGALCRWCQRQKAGVSKGGGHNPFWHLPHSGALSRRQAGNCDMNV